MNQGKSLRLGLVSTESDGVTPSNSMSRYYCIPGDTAVCDPPVGEWKFDEMKGTTVKDYSGNGNNGTWGGTGAHWADVGKINGAGKFNGSDDTVTILDKSIFEGQSQLTASIWVWDDANRSQNDYFNKGNEGVGASSTFAFIGNTNGIRVRVSNNSGTMIDLQPTGAGVFIDNSWNLLTVTYDGLVVRLYSNGVLRASTPLSGLTCENTYPVTIGGGPFGNDGFNGKLDDARIYNYARTPAQIAWDYNRGKPIGWWKLDEGQGSRAVDSSGNGNHGALTNMTPATDWVTGKFNKGLDFDGSDDYVSVVDNGIILDFDAVKPYTWTAWINWRSFPTSQQCYISKDLCIVKNTGYNLCLSQTGGTADAVICINTCPGNLWSCSPGLNLGLANSTWMHITTIYDGASNWSTYINGAYKGNQTLALYSDTVSNLYIGSGTTGFTQPNPGRLFSGQIDDVRIYNYALTAEQVKQVMNEGSAVRFGE